MRDGQNGIHPSYVKAIDQIETLTDETVRLLISLSNGRQNNRLLAEKWLRTPIIDGITQEDFNDDMFRLKNMGKILDKRFYKVVENLTGLYEFSTGNKKLNDIYKKEIEQLPGNSLQEKQDQFTQYLKEETKSLVKSAANRLVEGEYNLNTGRELVR